MRRVVSVVRSWRQFALFPRAELKRLTLSRRQQIDRRLVKQGQGAHQEPPGGAERKKETHVLG
jgi:hypothetical protein